MGAAPAPADVPVEAPDKSVVPEAAFVVVVGEIVEGTEGVVVVGVSGAVVGISDDGAVSSIVWLRAICGQTLIASGSIVIIKTLRAFKIFLCDELRSRQKIENLGHGNARVSGSLSLINFFST